MSNLSIGDKVKVIDQEIIGTILYDLGNKVVISDDDAEDSEDTLIFNLSDLEEINDE